MLTQIVAKLIEQAANTYDKKLDTIFYDLISGYIASEIKDIKDMQESDRKWYHEERQKKSNEAEQALLQELHHLFSTISTDQLEDIDTYSICNGQTLLETVVYLNWILVVELLLQKKAKANIWLRDGKTLLMLVCQGGYIKGECINPDYLEVKMVSLLLEHGADVREKTEKGTTALHYAAKGETDAHVQTVGLLLEYGPDPNARTSESIAGINSGVDETPLHWANRLGHRNSAALLIENDAQIELDMLYPESNILALYKLQEQQHALDKMIREQIDLSYKP